MSRIRESLDILYEIINSQGLAYDFLVDELLSSLRENLHFEINERRFLQRLRYILNEKDFYKVRERFIDALKEGQNADSDYF